MYLDVQCVVGGFRQCVVSSLLRCFVIFMQPAIDILPTYYILSVVYRYIRRSKFSLVALVSWGNNEYGAKCKLLVVSRQYRKADNFFIKTGCASKIANIT